ncbi:MAG: methyltransferase domain-containing protein, partial [Planctomycetota bacterium]
MKKKKQIFITFACLLVVLYTLSDVKAQTRHFASLSQTSGTKAHQAELILNSTGIKGGLVVHIGCGDGQLTAALHVNDSYLIHGLDTDENNIIKAREHIRSLGLYGKVS